MKTFETLVYGFFILSFLTATLHSEGALSRDSGRKDIIFTQYSNGTADFTWNTNAMDYQEAIDHVYNFIYDESDDFYIVKVPKDTSLMSEQYKRAFIGSEYLRNF